MNRIHWAAIPAAMGLAIVPQNSIAKAPKSEKPNILWIVTDDHRADALECWNMAKTGTTESKLGYVSSPNLNKIASEGVLFTNSYCNSPVSGPSRGSMHTGMYPHHNGMFNFQVKHNGLDVSHPIIPQVMRDNGYNAAAFGKIGYYIYDYAEPINTNGYPGHYPQFVTERDLEKSGFSDVVKAEIDPSLAKAPRAEKYRVETWRYPDGRKVEYKIYPKGSDKDTPENRSKYDAIINSQELLLRAQNAYGEIIGGESTMPTDMTQDGYIASEVSRYLDNAGHNYNSIIGKEMVAPNPSDPQLLYVGFHFPHTPVLPSKEYRDMFKDKEYNLPYFDDAEFQKMSNQVKSWHKSTNISNFTDDEKQQMIQDYYAFCAMGDEMIGKTVDRFKKYCADNDQEYLILIVCGDHGWHLGEQGSCFKASAFLKSNQTAVIALSSDKSKFPAGKVVTDFVEYVDIAPTIYSAAGIDVTDKAFEHLDGIDLELTANSKVTPREYVLGEVQSSGNRAFLRSKNFAFSMRSRKGNGNPSLSDMPNSNVKWPLECSAEEADLGLYDLRVDPLERNNVAYDDEYKELAQWFREKLGNIVLGDDRMEVVWSEKNVYNISSFAKGSDDKKLDIPKDIIPEI